MNAAPNPLTALDLPLWMFVAGGAVLLFVVVALVAAIAMLRRKEPPAEPAADALAVNIQALPSHGPSAEFPRLEVFGVPVRLAVVVLAPAGRGTLPTTHELSEVLEAIAPGLTDVFRSQSPKFRHWPAQLSSHGFIQSFFNKLALPGDHGKRTPWTSIAGKLEWNEQTLLAGFVCCADGPNSLGQFPVDHEGKWHEVMRVRLAE